MAYMVICNSLGGLTFSDVFDSKKDAERYAVHMSKELSNGWSIILRKVRKEA